MRFHGLVIILQFQYSPLPPHTHTPGFFWSPILKIHWQYSFNHISSLTVFLLIPFHYIYMHLPPYPHPFAHVPFVSDICPGRFDIFAFVLYQCFQTSYIPAQEAKTPIQLTYSHCIVFVSFPSNVSCFMQELIFILCPNIHNPEKKSPGII